MEHQNQGKDYKDWLVIKVYITNMIMLAYNLDLKFPAGKSKWETVVCSPIKKEENCKFLR